MKLLCTEWQRHCYNRRTWQLLDRYRKSYCLTQWRLLSDSPLIPGDSSTLGQAQDEPTFNAKAAKDHGPLPLPPMMDPVKLAARYKYRAPKRRSTSLNLTKLQRELKNNPYAYALATPIRQCTVTSMRLPNAFLLGFKLVAHPKTGAPWLVPSNLAQPADPPSGADSDQSSGEGDVRGGSRNVASSEGNRRHAPDSPGSYVLAKDFLVRRLTGQGPNTRRGKGWAAVVNPRMQQRYPLRGKTVKWPKNIDDLILRLLRQRTVRELAYLASRTGTGYVKSVKEGLGVSKGRVGCVLWLGPSGSSSAQDNEPEERRVNAKVRWDPMTGPAPYETMGQGVAVYNLPQLLGTNLVAELRKKLGQYKDEEVLVLKSKWAVVRAQTWLWKLQGFLTSPPESGRF